MEKTKEEPKKRCGVKRKSDGAPCQNWPDPFTLSGRCRFHGGRNARGPAHYKYKHGKYSKYVKKDIFNSINEFLNEDEVRDLRKELSILRGLLHSYMQHHDDILEDPRIDTITKLVDKVEKLVSSLKVIEEGHTFTIKNVNNIILQLVKIVQLRVKDDSTKRLIAEDVRQLTYVSTV